MSGEARKISGSGEARRIRASDKRRLYTLSGNECANPNCNRSLTGSDDGKTNIGEVCHIEAASKGGVRYNPKMTDPARRHFRNLIMLCSECHSIIDNPENKEKYSVGLLRIWKQEHEDKHKNNFARRSTELLRQAIDIINNADFEDKNIEQNEDLEPFKIDEKISYNAIERKSEIIKEYAPYSAELEKIYSVLEKQGSSFKIERLLRHIRNIYLRVKEKFVNGSENETIQTHAYDIFEEVENQLFEMIQYPVHRNDIGYAMSIIMVDAFMRCKILEEPPYDIG